jgi:hypothetical protein
VDLPWFLACQGRLGEPRARAKQSVQDPDLETEIILYGNEEAIHHLRIMIHTEDDTVAQACTNKNIHQWISALEISSALATSVFTTAAKLQKNSAAFMVFLGQGDVDSLSIQLNLQYAPAARADFDSAARLMAAWKPNFKIHLHYLSRFLNDNLPPEVRWLNGYRALEWHFKRGKTGLANDAAYRTFLDLYGAMLDTHLRVSQTRYGLLEEIRALIAHALLSKSTDQNDDSTVTDPVLKTFSALESLVMQLMNDGVADGIVFHPKPTPTHLE